MSRYKILLINMGLGIILAIVWALLAKNRFTPFSIVVTLSFISLVAAPVDLVASIVFLLTHKKERGYGFLMSSGFFALILFFTFVVWKL
jgi:hypothetical protein